MVTRPKWQRPVTMPCDGAMRMTPWWQRWIDAKLTMLNWKRWVTVVTVHIGDDAKMALEWGRRVDSVGLMDQGCKWWSDSTNVPNKQEHMKKHHWREENVKMIRLQIEKTSTQSFSILWTAEDHQCCTTYHSHHHHDCISIISYMNSFNKSFSYVMNSFYFVMPWKFIVARGNGKNSIDHLSYKSGMCRIS